MLSMSCRPPRAMGILCSTVSDIGSGDRRFGLMGSPQRQHALLLASHLAWMRSGVALPSASALALRARSSPAASGLRSAHFRQASLYATFP